MYKIPQECESVIRKVFVNSFTARRQLLNQQRTTWKVITNYWFCLKISLSRKAIVLLPPRKQTTFCDATNGFPANWRLRNKRRNSILMTRHYPDLGSASDWLKQISLAAPPIRSTTKIWVVTRHQYGISVLVSRTSLRGETGWWLREMRLFSQATANCTVLWLQAGFQRLYEKQLQVRLVTWKGFSITWSTGIPPFPIPLQCWITKYIMRNMRNCDSSLTSQTALLGLLVLALGVTSFIQNCSIKVVMTGPWGHTS